MTATLTGIAKTFGPVTALDGATLELRPGEVHGVVGENGAGKSTLLGVLGGHVRPDSGTVSIAGRTLRFRKPRDAWRAGVGLVHQHFALVPPLTGLENLALGWRGGAGIGIPFDELRARVDELTERSGLVVTVDRPVEELSVGARQRLEIVKVLLRRPSYIALDEPTAVLAPAEIDRLFGFLRDLAAEGTAVALVAHKLDEVLAVSDRVTVLRAGRTVLTAPRSEVDVDVLTPAMIGYDPHELPDVELNGREERERTSTDQDRAPVVSLKDVYLGGERDEQALRGASIEVHRGEIVGVAGVEGNGQRDLARVLAGLESPEEGEVSLPADVGFIPQDRTVEGLAAGLDLVENVALGLQRDPSFRRGPFLDWRALREATQRLMQRFDVRAPGLGATAASLSGGNQQRLVVARETDRSAPLLVAENPTRGLDVGAAAYVHSRLAELARDGTAIVLLSTDLDEILLLADRVLVMSRGRLETADRSREAIGRRMVAADA